MNDAHDTHRRYQGTTHAHFCKGFERVSSLHGQQRLSSVTRNCSIDSPSTRLYQSTIHVQFGLKSSECLPQIFRTTPPGDNGLHQLSQTAPSEYFELAQTYLPNGNSMVHNCHHYQCGQSCSQMDAAPYLQQMLRKTLSILGRFLSRAHRNLCIVHALGVRISRSCLTMFDKHFCRMFFASFSPFRCLDYTRNNWKGQYYAP